MRSELGKQIEGQAATSQQPTKCANEKNEKGEKIVRQHPNDLSKQQDSCGLVWHY